MYRKNHMTVTITRDETDPSRVARLEYDYWDKHGKKWRCTSFVLISRLYDEMIERAGRYPECKFETITNL